MSLPYPNLIDLPMPILTPRLLLRPPQAGDGPAYNKAVIESLEHLRTFLPWALQAPTQEESESNVRRWHVNTLNRVDIPLPIFDRQTGALLGGSGMHRIDWDLPFCEIGYWVHKDAQGQGVVSEAVNAITRYAFDQLQMKRVEIRCETSNTRSRNVAERLGFQLDGILRHNRYKVSNPEELTDTYVYSRLNTDGLPELSVTY